MNLPLITVDPDIQSGVPVFAGTRVPVQNLFDYIEEGDSLDHFLRQFPSVSRDAAVAVLEQSRDATVEEAWRQEIRRRVSAYERGETELHDADDVIAEAKRIAP